MSYELHEPTFHETTTERWEAPDQRSLDSSRIEGMDGHFLLSESGFPPESFSDLELPVVDELGRLNRNALADAAYGPNSVESLDVDDETEEAVKDLAHELLREEFDSLPETMDRPEERERMLAWLEEQQEHEHEVEQKLHTDDEERELQADETEEHHSAERPEKGR